MSKENSNYTTFLDTIKENPKAIGREIRKIIHKNNRFLLNMPFIGAARKISKQLQDESFSLFYIFERTLAHKLHPLLYSLNLNLFTNKRIAQNFNNKFNQYENIAPFDFDRLTITNDESKFKIFADLKQLITTMEEFDGHFMFIKFCDFILSRRDRDYAFQLRNVELTVNLMKKSLTEDKNSNIETIKQKYEKFTKDKKNIYSDILIERMRWDDKLKEYCDMLTKSDERTGSTARTAQTSYNAPETIINEEDEYNDQENYEKPLEENIDKIASEVQTSTSSEENLETDKISDHILKYAQTVKDTYLDNIADNDSEMINQLIEKLFSLNKDKYGEEKAKQILQDIIDIWLNDNTISDNKKDLLKNSLISAGIIAAEEPDQFQISESSTEEAQAFEINENQDEELGEFSITDKTEDISEERISSSEEETLDITDNLKIIEESTESDTGEELNISEESTEELDSFDISEEEQDKQRIKNFLDSKSEQLEQLENYLAENIKAAEEELKQILNEKDQLKLSSRVLNISNNEIYNEHNNLINSLLAENADADNLFLKIIRYLEDGPFKVMTISEKFNLLDEYIEKYKDNQKLCAQLKNYKQNLASSQQMLREIFLKLSQLEKDYPAFETCINQQLKYLEKLIKNENYKPVWKTIFNIYKNIINQTNSQQSFKEFYDSITNESLSKQTEILNYLKDFYRDEKNILKEIEKIHDTEGLKKFFKRMKKEELQDPLKLEKVLKDIYEEKINLNEWLENSMSQTVQPQIESEEQKETSTVKENLNKNIAELINQSDFTESSDIEKMNKLIKQELAENKSQTISSLETIITDVDLDPLAREIILNNYAEEKDPALQKLSEFHTLIDNTLELKNKEETINQFYDNLPEKYKDETFQKTIENKKQFIKEEAESNKKADHFINTIDQAEDKLKFLSSISKDENVPQRAKKVAERVNSAVQQNSFNEAFHAITTSNTRPEFKIKLLETLKTIAKKHNWISDDPSDKNSIDKVKKIDNKIEFYNKILNRKSHKAEYITKSKNNILNRIKNDESATIPEEPKKKANGQTPQTTAKETPEVESEDMSNEEKIYIRSLNILKAFKDNCLAISPATTFLLQNNTSEFAQKLRNHFSIFNNESNQYISNTLNMLETENADSDLIKAIHKSPAKIQYTWRESILQKSGKKNLEDAFKIFENDKDFYAEIKTLNRIIDSNNKNDFVKKTIEKEKNLVKDMLTDLSIANLKKLRSKTFGRQDKDKINLFRDLLQLTGDMGKVENILTEEPATASATPEKENPYLTKTFKEIEVFLNYCKSDKTRDLFFKSTNRVALINNFFEALTKADENAIEVTKQHEKEIINLFVNIAKYKYTNKFPAANSAYMYSLSNNLIDKSKIRKTANH